jgi:titin
VTFASAGLSGSTTYYYRVIARDQSGSPSPASATASATTFQGPPAAPTNLTASAASSTQINLFWNDNSSNEASFAIETAPSSSGPWSLATAPPMSLYYHPASGGTTYYRVRRQRRGTPSSNAACDDLIQPSRADGFYGNRFLQPDQPE